MKQEQIGRESLNPRLRAGNRDICLTLLGEAHSPWAVLVLPGGGYHMTAPREGVPVAEAFAEAGFRAAVLEYSVSPDRWPQAMLEAAAAVALLRQRGARCVAVCGFSAGGHLAGSLANLWHSGVIAEQLGLEEELARPDAAILCYPVITAKPPYGHPGSFVHLVGEGRAVPPPLSLEDSVGPDTPPAFLWVTGEDDSVPMENTLIYAGALRRAGVPFELHVYPKGPHAMALADERTRGRPEQQDPHVATWFPLCIQWLKGL